MPSGAGALRGWRENAEMRAANKGNSNQCVRGGARSDNSATPPNTGNLKFESGGSGEQWKVGGASGVGEEVEG